MKIQTELTIGKKKVICNNVVVEHRLNELSTFTASIGPKYSFSLFDPIVFKVNDKVIFTGEYTGAQLAASTLSGTSSMTISGYGGLHKLAQMSLAFPGLQTMGANSINRVSTFAPRLLKTILNMHIQSTNSVCIIDDILGIMTHLFSYIRQAAKESTTYHALYGSLDDAVYKLGELHSTVWTKVFSEQTGKVKRIGDLSGVRLSSMSADQVKYLIYSMLGSPSVSMWNMLMQFLEVYQLNIGNTGSTTYIFPNQPVGTPGMELDLGRTHGIQTSSLPIRIPTRCYITTSINVNAKSTNTHSYGAYPTEVESGKLTKMEEKIGAIRALQYECPGFTTWQTTSNNSTQKLLDAFAKTYLVKEIFKRRTASIDMIPTFNIPVGMIITYKDTFYKHSYQGMVTSVTHNISVGSASTALGVQYVLESGEILDMGIGDFRKSPIYFNYTAALLKGV